MARLVAFEFRVGEVGEPGGGEGRVVEAGVGGEGGGELADEVAEGGAVELEEATGPDQEVEGVGHGPALVGDRVGGDVPAAVGASPGTEREGRAVVQAQCVETGCRVGGGTEVRFGRAGGSGGGREVRFVCAGRPEDGRGVRGRRGAGSRISS